MPFYKKILILLILIFFGFLIFKLMMDRRILLSQFHMEGFQSGEVLREGAWFTAPTIDEELAQVKTIDIPTGISNIQDGSLTLNQYCIKGAYNTALTGTYMNTEMIKYVLSRGCRFLDFEVFSFENSPYVAYSTDPTFSTIQSKNKITLREALTTVASNAFGAPSPNVNDPIFIHLRIKSNNSKLYDAITKNIKDTVDSYLYNTNNKALLITGTTKLNDIMGKILIIVDRTYTTPAYINSTLANYANMESASDVLRRYDYSFLSLQQYTSPNIKDDGKNTDVSMMKLVMPNMTPNIVGMVQNSIYYPMVLNYGAQIVLYPFYIVDMYLGQYETAFANGKSAFVPLVKMIPILNNMIHPINTSPPTTA